MARKRKKGISHFNDNSPSHTLKYKIILVENGQERLKAVFIQTETCESDTHSGNNSHLQNIKAFPTWKSRACEKNLGNGRKFEKEVNRLTLSKVRFAEKFFVSNIIYNSVTTSLLVVFIQTETCEYIR